MKRSTYVRLISFAAAVILIIGLLPAAGVFADKKLIVHEINLIEVSEPVAGEHPVFHAATDAVTCLVIDNPDSEGSKNGVYWIEYTKEGEFVRRMTETDTFREGYDYMFGVSVAAAPFAEFDNYYVGTLDATVNGVPATIWTYVDHVTVTCTFPCGTVIESLSLSVVRPKVGNTPTFARINSVRFESKNDDPRPQNQTNGVTWTNTGTGVNLSVSNQFKEQVTYKYSVSLYPKDGYSFASNLTAFVNGMSASVKAEADHVTVSIPMAATYKNPFDDVPEDKWYTEAALFCNYHGYMTGTSDTTFSPSSAFTRAMFVTVLAKVDMADTSSYTGSSFTDVPEGKWYSKPIEWAAQNSYASGIGGGMFGPSSPVTREQLTVFLYNYTVKKGMTVSDLADISGYPDAGSVSGYAREAMAWAVGNGLISGVKQGETLYLSPKGGATRAQVALIIMNYVNKTTL